MRLTKRNIDSKYVSVFRVSKDVHCRGLWSPETDESENRLSNMNKEKTRLSTSLDVYRTWRIEHAWSASSSSMKSEHSSYRNKSDTDQIAAFSAFRIAANEIERLKKEARELTRRKAEQEHTEEIEAHDVSKFSDHLEALKAKRIELEASRETIVRRMQQLHAQISVRRKEERDIWKQKYLLEKKKTTELEDTIKETTKDEPDLSFQIEQAKIRLNNAAKLRLQAETECRTLKQELHQIRLNMNNLEKPSLTKQPSSLQLQTQQQQQQQPNIPINLDITLQY